MENRRFWGIIIILILIIGLFSAIYVSVLGFPGDQEKKNQEKQFEKHFQLTDSQMPGVNYVNLNLITNASGVAVNFQNDSKLLYNITFSGNNNTPAPKIEYHKVGNVLFVNLTYNTGSSQIILGNRCIYNSTLDAKVGGYNINLANRSRIDNLNANIKYAGGGVVNIADTSFNNLNLGVNLGGFSIMSNQLDMLKSGKINSNIQIGGAAFQIKPEEKIGIKIIGTVDLGGITFEPTGYEVIQNKTNKIDIQTTKYNQKPVKLVINSNIGLGGININMFPLFIPMQT
jgi:hypothetical protein